MILCLSSFCPPPPLLRLYTPTPYYDWLLTAPVAGKPSKLSKETEQRQQASLSLNKSTEEKENEKSAEL